MGEIPFAIARERLERAIAISDDAALRAMKFAFRHLKLVLEPSGAITLAAALEGGLDLKGQTIALIASGSNVDAVTFARALAA
jgi:threonine dehydratase